MTGDGFDWAALVARENAARDIGRIPPAVLASINNYAKHGLQPGSCVGAILSGDLFWAFASGDISTLEAMPAIVEHIVRILPATHYGSAARVDRWIRECAARNSQEQP